MAVEIKVPALGESVTEATVAKWLVKAGDKVAVDQPLCELETDKVTVEVNASVAGTIADLAVEEGASVQVGGVLCHIEAGAGAASAPKPAAAPAPAPAAPKPAPGPAVAAPAGANLAASGPAARKLAEEKGVPAAAIEPTGKDGRATKEDVLAALSSIPSAAAPAAAAKPAAPSGPRPKADREERVKMTRLRRTIANRLKEAQNTAAMLTTFNEVDMTAVMAMRERLKDDFEKKHGARLGFMSFFVKACIAGLKELPAVNAEIEGEEIVYKNYYDIGVAVGSPQGLVVPVLRDADALDFAGIEKGIGDLGRKARDGKLSIGDLTGGTFTISNGGVYGSLMSTPILNPPQSAILGMHKIQQRPMVVGGEIKARPMMYLALSYDHRIIDGREAVLFLVKVKEGIEDPERLLLGL
ncbi:2-oxoglutarate dehydrogenase complex dihydrolipoyllysine-residue succinyltransferase [Reyranella sp.]|jgi:2-oxoglutarate dehydrogenase E2 component (dihydrolipoamide succinyltransferase)|uniref:2-oxoglutarate dehydrogenase complex dihydrolipoyllysine-residue succinyltransferase n=1 Tax=Reyranella sp. TaxID=1929291 RepID=UPI000BCB4251|nr:2-oxoglutarate dehydrogenase complex dihydrolipoyllysine-residue succinyltransferase [Reyranella sp.]OYY35454.1 MAG: dihydrolipoamide succinyltransferase [Rhodospirillales bacterium 35-66-84]OYZ96652.1 MAG: dihydrolipoamide succinyltransferase [Rhodospirillales bacterium 24-66-33]OZB28020.1 MAG: dihydrolipoamide succinyltransferase [Rhodospirillales bacterium 39-66-50]HQS18492.1 2-oxoglutarate dehydrogenase complex dihydrolipoyllysine-residue succinyltransferase [Reyranella sp.]HQT10015.1 2